MADGFKVADAYISVHTDDDTRRGRQQIERDTSRWANALGLRIGNTLGRSLAMSIFKIVSITLSSLFQITKWMAIAAAVGAAVQAVAALVVALGKLLGLAPLIVPAVLSMVSAFAALKIAFSGVGAAIQAGWEGDVEKLTEALKKLHPEAQKLVKTLLALKPQLVEFKKAVQGAFFKDLAADIQVLASVFLPLLQRHLVAVASIFNEFASAFLRWLSFKEVLDDWRTTFEAIQVVLRNVLISLLNVIIGFQHIGTVAAPILAEISNGFINATLRFAQLMADMRADGTLEKFIRDALRVGGQLLELFGNLWAILSPIFHALATGEGNVLELMIRLTQQLADLLSTAQATEAIQALFGALNDILVALGPGVVALLGALGKTLLAMSPGLTALAQFVSEGLIQLGPVLVMAGGFLAEILQGLAPILPLLAQTLGTLVTIIGPALVELAPVIYDLFGALAAVVPPIASVLADFILAAGPGIVEFVRALADGLAALIPVAAPVGRALGELLAALGPILPVIGQLLADVLAFLVPVVQELTAILAPFIAAWAKVSLNLWAKLLPLILEIAEKAGPRLVELFDLLTRTLEPFIPLIMQLTDIFLNELIQYMPQFEEILDQLLPVLTQIVILFGQYLLQAFQAIAPMLPSLVGLSLQLVLVFLKLYAAMAPLIPPFLQMVLAFQRLFIETGLAQVALMWFGVAIGSVIVVIMAITEVVKIMVSVVTTVVRKVTEFANMVTTAIKGVWDFISDLPGKLAGASSSIVNALYNAGRNTVMGFWNGIASLGGWLWSKVSGFVRDNVLGAFGRALGLGSPSKAAAKLAHWVPLGVAKGMDSERQAVVDAATRLAMAALPALRVPQPSLPSMAGESSSGRGKNGGDVYVLADFGDGVRQLVKATIADEPELVAASTDEGRRERGFSYSPRARL